MRTSWLVAPTVRTAATVTASVRVHPISTEGMTAAGLKTPKAEAMTSPGAWPRAEPRLVK
jgi:hypothetical protein